jgi:LPS-assembly protein
MTPGVNLKLIGRRIANSPFYFDLDGSLGGMNRSDRLIETPTFSQRFDLFPRLYLSIPLFQGLRLTPTVAFRETFYSDSLTVIDGQRAVVGDSLRREYLDLTLDLRGWGLSRIYRGESERKWKHLFEPALRYRLIAGVDNFDQLLRYDEVDAVADTSEIEYALVNRLFVKNSRQANPHEWLSLKIGQKYFFDPTFGGAFKNGRINQFFPLNALTGIPYAIGERDWSPLTTLVRFNPNRRSSFDVRGDYDSQAGEFRSFSFTGFFNRDFFSFATTYFVTHRLSEDLDQSNQIQGRISVGNAQRGLSSFAMFSYDSQASRFLNHLVRVSYFWDCCGVSAEVRGFNITNRDENQVRFSFFLKGIGSFGTLRRPDNVF